MTDINNKYYAPLSDNALLVNMGQFIKHHRLAQNKTQQALATAAGINRTTLSEFEQGKRSNTITLIQLLRALNLLHILQIFEIEDQISPLLLAEMQHKYRKRASKPNNNSTPKTSDW